jgi:hypothetical protein
MLRRAVKLTRLQSNHSRLRTSEVIGFCDEMPQVGKTFQMISEPLEQSKGFRLINTNPVTEINGDEFKTCNSTYRIEDLDPFCEVCAEPFESEAARQAHGGCGDQGGI